MTTTERISAAKDEMEAVYREQDAALATALYIATCEVRARYRKRREQAENALLRLCSTKEMA